MSDYLVRLGRLAVQQFGVVTMRQLVALGMSVRQIERLQGKGLLIPMHRGVYRASAVPPSFRQRLLAACLAGGAVASHRGAAAMWGLRGVTPVVEVTVAGRRRPELEGVVTHTTARLGDDEMGRHGAIPLTRVGRTLLDLGAVSHCLVEPALEDAVHRGLVTLSSVRATLERAGAHGRAGTAVLRALVAERAPGRQPTESPLEDALAGLLRRHGLPEPRRQHRVRLPGGSVVRLDLAYPESKLAIEADGRIWHSGRSDFERDRRRGNALADLGWATLRYGWDDVRQRGPEVADAVSRMCCRAG